MARNSECSVEECGHDALLETARREAREVRRDLVVGLVLVIVWIAVMTFLSGHVGVPVRVH